MKNLLLVSLLSVIILSGCTSSTSESGMMENNNEENNTIQNDTNDEDEQREPNVENIPTMQQEPEPVITKPILKNIGFTIDKYDPAAGKAGDILFVNKIGDHYNNQIFLEYGFEVMGPNGPKKLVSPTYFLPLGTKLISPVQGKMEKIINQGTDYEILMIPNDLQNWRISFDHIINLKVKEGDEVNPGDILGEVAERNSEAIPPELGWTELQIWESVPIGPLTVCPFTLLDDSIREDIETKITQLAVDWEGFIGKNVYAQENWTSPGCLTESLVDQ